MKKIFIILISLIFISIFFSFQNKNKGTIYILPLGNVTNHDIKIVQNSLISFYGYKCDILNEQSLTKDLYSPSRKRYSADKILNKFNSNKHIIVITSVDITTEKNGSKEWGVFGLGRMPGKVCVVSTFRLKNLKNKQYYEDRLKKISIHEVGHNFGLSHCEFDEHCLMNDAKGTIRKVDSEKIWICDFCRKKLKLFGFFLN
jgi:archaemetzincin